MLAQTTPDAPPLIVAVVDPEKVSTSIRLEAGAWATE